MNWNDKTIIPEKEPADVRPAEQPDGEALITIYTHATRMAISRNQTIGPRHEYYITLAQLEIIMLRPQPVASPDKE